MTRIITVDLGDGAQMTVPTHEWTNQLRYGRDNSQPGQCDDRMLAAGVCESFLYLIEECSKDEAWRRIKLMKTTLAKSNI